MEVVWLEGFSANSVTDWHWTMSGFWNRAQLWSVGAKSLVLSGSQPSIQTQIYHVTAVSCRIEKEIETLEREELNISTNEGLILNRLKAIEKSTKDIIKVKLIQILFTDSTELHLRDDALLFLNGISYEWFEHVEC